MKTENTKKALREVGGSFRLFARNGRWGTCVACPKDGDGNALPELCQFTERYDHNLDVHQLATTYQNYLK